MRDIRFIKSGPMFFFRLLWAVLACSFSCPLTTTTIKVIP